jgi:hypothetical protein
LDEIGRRESRFTAPVAPEIKERSQIDSLPTQRRGSFSGLGSAPSVLQAAVDSIRGKFGGDGGNRLNNTQNSSTVQPDLDDMSGELLEFPVQRSLEAASARIPSTRVRRSLSHTATILQALTSTENGAVQIISLSQNIMDGYWGVGSVGESGPTSSAPSEKVEAADDVCADGRKSSLTPKFSSRVPSGTLLSSAGSVSALRPDI